MQEKSETELLSENLIRAFTQFKRIRLQKLDRKHRPSHWHHMLKHSEFILLMELAEAEQRYPDGISVSDLSGRLRVKPPSITSLIGGLEHKGMLERSMDESDRRIIRIRLKEEGKNVAKEEQRHMVALMKDYVAYMGDEKCRTLTALINETFTFLDSQDQKRK
ncbi:MAG: MarR family transcriptional regulator [Oscillospiraceae bacterium]|nr:MarR family transcriptional regulator [Oscillospiraceae bacterium]